MYNKITQENNVNNYKRMIAEEPLCFLTPRRKTLTFIMQYACAYHVEKSLPSGISGIILN
ncbi:MAG: hypothetical protein LBV57_01560 [Candidatus Symbiothrix sp.]|jgi:hypothetical protein|nr:hypothetical protein [Candidatus Symbiothrix sp.]